MHIVVPSLPILLYSSLVFKDYKHRLNTHFYTVWACFNTTYQPAFIRLCFLGAERTLFLVRPGFLSLSHEAPSTHRKRRGLFPRNREGGSTETNGEKKLQFLCQNKLDVLVLLLLCDAIQNILGEFN